MTDLTLRSVKGSPISNIEGDNNFVNASDIGKNFIQNGNFDIWQGGTNANSGLDFEDILCDRWEFSADTSEGDTYNVSRGAFTLGQTDVPGNPKYYYDISITGSGTPAAGNHTLSQAIESVYTLSGEEVTLSFWGKASTSATVGVYVSQTFGFFGSVFVTTKVNDTILGTSWAKYELTFTVPSISGKDMGDTSLLKDKLHIYFDIPSGTTIDYNFSRVQLEKGNVATEFEHIPIGLEFERCQRYLQMSYNSDDYPADTTVFSGAVAVTVPPSGSSHPKCTVEFPTRMLQEPLEFFIYSPVSGLSNKLYNYQTGTDSPTLVVESLSETGFEISHSGINLIHGVIHYVALCDGNQLV